MAVGDETTAGGRAAVQNVPEIWYGGGDMRRRVPEWARGLIELGAATAGARNRDLRLVVAVVVPTRVYAATLAAVGADSLQRPVAFNPSAPTTAELEQHFQQLRGLRPGRTVTVGAAKLVGSFIGIDESGEEPLVVIRQTKLRCIQKMPLRSCHLVGITGRSLSSLLIGRLNVFEIEITGGDLCLSNRRPLQETLKVGRYSPRGDKDIRCAVLSSGGDLPDELQDAKPRVVIFDGVPGFRHWRETWRVAPWLIVLDRTAANFEEGVSLVEDEYVRRDADEPALDLPLPPGVEVMGFWTAH